VGGVGGLGGGEVEAEAGRVFVLVHQLDGAVQLRLRLERAEDLEAQSHSNINIPLAVIYQFHTTLHVHAFVILFHTKYMHAQQNKTCGNEGLSKVNLAR
jgi:hypothetical protein